MLLTPALSVIIPVAPGETAWRDLVIELASGLGSAEIILGTASDEERDDSGPEPSFLADFRAIKQVLSDADTLHLSWTVAPKGRASQLNAAARHARGQFLWFLHADTRLTPGALEALRGELFGRPDALHFFDLAFQKDGGIAAPLMPVNALFANLRSRILAMPFGDQGLAVARRTFEAASGFDERVPYGEDHLFVWRVRQAGVPLHAIGLPLLTSARKYAQIGWARLTAKRLLLTYKQAAPEAVRLLKATLEKKWESRPKRGRAKA